MDPLSVVIPTQNTRDLVVECVQSVRAADASCEIVVVDDGGNDDTPAALAASGLGVDLVRLEQTQGFSRAVNLGIKRTHAATVLLLNSDTTIADVSSLRALHQAFSADPQLGIVGATLRFPDGRLQWSGGGAPTPSWLFALASDLPRRLPRRPSGHRVGPVEWVTGAALAVRRQVLEEIGLLDEAFDCYGQDVELCLRAGASGWRVEVEAGFEVNHIGGATIGADSRRIGWLWADLVRVIRRRQGARAARRAVLALATGALVRIVLLQGHGVREALVAAHRAAREPGSGTIPHLPKALDE